MILLTTSTVDAERTLGADFELLDQMKYILISASTDLRQAWWLKLAQCLATPQHLWHH
jgi:hypothetical protein